MSKYIVFSTVGTSITNNIDLNYKEAAFFDEWKNSQFTLFEKNKSKYQDKIDASNDNFSAEIRSLTKLYEKLKTDDENVELDVHLLCTDTVISPVCAWCIQQWFIINEEKYSGITVNFKFNENHVIRDLRVTESIEVMENGFAKMIERIKNVTTSYVDEIDEIDGEVYRKKPVIEKNVILNFTGGYKGIIPYLTIIAAIYNWELIYSYDDANDQSAALLQIGDLPLHFDISAAETYYPLMQNNLIKDKFFTNNNRGIYKQIEKLRLIRETEDNIYQVTTLGKIFCEFIEEKSQMGHKDLMSFVVEYKVLEYFNREIYTNNNLRYSKLKHSENLMIGDRLISEIDILLQTNDLRNAIIAEVKSFNQIEKVKTQASKQLKFLRHPANHSRCGRIKEYFIILYNVIEPNTYIFNQDKERYATQIQEIEETIKNIDNSIVVKIFKLNIFRQEHWHKQQDKTKIPANMYQKFMQTKIDNQPNSELKLEPFSI